MEVKFSLGNLVLSKAGRDKERLFIILKVLDDQYVYIADGDLRKIEAPKKKKIKHLKMLGTSSSIREKLMTDKKVTNAMLRKEIETFGLEYSIGRTDIDG